MPGVESRQVTNTDEGLGLSTYRSFYLIRDELRQVLECGSLRERITLRNVQDAMTMGTIHCEAAFRFARATGLLDRSARITPFARMLLAHDPRCDDIRTQWLLHYHMARPHTEGPSFWPRLYAWLVSKASASRDDMIAFLADQAGIVLDPASRTLKYAIAAFAGTYTRNDGLGTLGLLELDGEHLCPAAPAALSTGVVSYLVADYWQHRWENRKTVNLAAMTEKGGPADLLMLSSGDMNSYLGDMGERGFVEVQRRIPPYQVMRLWDDPEAILEQIYDS